MKSLIYFDNAATTFPKPTAVLDSVLRSVSSYCANPGRSSHRLAIKAAEEVYVCREALAKTLGASEECVVFTENATHSINLALKSLLKQGDHILISDIEHNAVLRPVTALAKDGVITYDIYTVMQDTEQMLSALEAQIRHSTKLICACYHSNICNTVLPIEAIARICKKHGVLLLVDASQAAGLLPINMKTQGIDILCAPGHKGLYGIPGCGFAIFSDGLAESGMLSTFIEGGNGVASLDPFMPELLPERLEAGTLPLPAICSLKAGLQFVNEIGTDNIYRHEKWLCSVINDGLSGIKKIRIHSKTNGSILLFSVDGVSSEDFATELDKHGVCVRAGFHCAPLAHKKLHTPQDGAVRVSLGALNTEKEALRFIDICKEILHG